MTAAPALLGFQALLLTASDGRPMRLVHLALGPWVSCHVGWGTDSLGLPIGRHAGRVGLIFCDQGGQRTRHRQQGLSTRSDSASAMIDASQPRPCWVA